MKGKKKRLPVAVWSCLMVGVVALGGFWWTFVKGTEAGMVDLSKGITHEYTGDEDTKGFINLNGNSVIIAESGNSTEEKRLCNIYLDTNQNGELEEGEKEAVPVDGEEDVDATLPIYGIYKQGSTTPISITVECGYQSLICGVYEGAIITDTAAGAACTMRMQGGNVGNFYAVRGSRIESSKTTAVVMDMTGGTIGNFVAFQQGSINAATDTGNAVTVADEDETLAAIDMNVSGGIIQGSCQGIEQGIQSGGEVITSGNIRKALSINVAGGADVKGRVYGVQGSAQVKGDIDLQIHPENSKSLGAVYGVMEGVMVDGSVAVNIDNITVGGVQVVYGSPTASNRINGDVSLITGKNVSASAYYLFSYSAAGGDVTADLYGDMREGATGGAQYYGVQNGSVEGKVDVTLQDGLFQNMVGVQNASVEGDVSILINSGTYTVNCWGIMASGVGGDVTITSGKTAEFKGSCVFRGCGDNSAIDGNVTVDIYNAVDPDTQVSTNFFGVSIENSTGDYYIAGAVDVKLHGGAWGSVVGMSLGSGVECRNTCNIEIDNVKIKNNNMIGIQGGAIKGDATVQVTKCQSGSSVTIYGIYGGRYQSTVEGNATVAITDSGVASGSVYGINNVVLSKDINITLENIDNNASAYSSYIYGVNNTSTDNGNVTIDMKGCASKYIYGVYGNCEVAQDANITMQNCTVGDYMYGMSGMKSVKNVTLISNDNHLNTFTGIERCTILGDVIITNNGDISESEEDNLYRGIYNGSVDGDITVTTKDCRYGGYYGVYRTDYTGNVQVTIDGGIYTGVTRQDASIYPYYCPDASSRGKKREVTVLLKNASFTATDSLAKICNAISDGYKLTMTIEDSCKISDAYEVYPNASDSGDALLIYGGNYYYTGSYPITEDITANNIFFGRDELPQITAKLLIPEDVTMTASGKIYLANQADILIEGALKGAIYESGDNDYSNGAVYMNGGTFEDSSKVRRLYYPVIFDYPKKGGTVAPAASKSNITTNSLRPELYFGFVGAPITVSCEAKKGYVLDEVTITKGESASEILTASSGTDYCFDMEACPAKVTASFSGTPITLDKEEDSLTTKLYEKTTKDYPLYDLTAIAITGDGEEGDVTYEISEESALPEGLVLEEGKLYGAATKAFEAGTDVMITVTGRNGTTAQFTLHITVMAGDEEGNPAYAVPEDLTAFYGDTLGDVILPSDENGAFTWQQETTTSVGGVGEQEFLVTYTPTNEKYKTVTDIQVTVVVQKAKVTFSKIEEVTANHGDTLADIRLPEAEGGEYYWVTPAVEPVDGEVYELGFTPTDVENYDWASIEGWNEEEGSILMSVNVLINHVYAASWEKDEENHWHECECGKIQGQAAHTWDAGVITNEATETEPGEKLFTCTVCEATKTEVIPATGTTHTHVFGETWEKDEESHWHECECGEIQEKAAHAWDAGAVIKEATEAEDGVKQYSCTVCGKTKNEAIKALGNTGNAPSHGDTTVQNPQQQGTTEAPKQDTGTVAAKGTVLTDSATKANYKVISGSGEKPAVQYLSSTDASATTLTIASSVTIDGVEYEITEIADNAFKNNKKLKKITIAGNIVTIGKSAFQGCTALTTVKMGSSVQTIKDKAFYGCKKLSSLTLGANVTTLGKSVFYNCISLKKVTIPKKVNKIGSKAFYGCKKLVNITIKTTKLTTKNVGSKAFTKAGSSNYKKLKVKVPKAKLKPYKTMLKKRGLSAKAKVTK